MGSAVMRVTRGLPLQVARRIKLVNTCIGFKILIYSKHSRISSYCLQIIIRYFVALGNLKSTLIVIWPLVINTDLTQDIRLSGKRTSRCSDHTEF